MKPPLCVIKHPNYMLPFIVDADNNILMDNIRMNDEDIQKVLDLFNASALTTEGA